MKLATLLLFLAIASAVAEDSNGRTWRGFPEAVKTGYLIGLSDGILAGAESGCFKVLSSACFGATGELGRSAFGQSTMGEIVEGVNDFYRDPANIQIPILNAMKYFQLKIHGAKPEELAQIVADTRLWAVNGASPAAPLAVPPPARTAPPKK
jgi:hypothetical protein